FEVCGDPLKHSTVLQRVGLHRQERLSDRAPDTGLICLTAQVQRRAARGVQIAEHRADAFTTEAHLAVTRNPPPPTAGLARARGRDAVTLVTHALIDPLCARCDPDRDREWATHLGGEFFGFGEHRQKGLRVSVPYG